MDERFHDGVDPQLLAQLGERRDGPGLVRLGVQFTLLLGSGALLVGATTPLAWSLGIALQGIAQVAFFGLLHECGHKTAFRSAWLNALGSWVASLPQLMAPAMFQEFHFTHHRHTHDLAHDPELAGLEFMARWPRGLLWLGTVSGLPVLFGRVAFMVSSALPLPTAVWERALPFVRARRRRVVAWQSRGLLVLHVAFVAAAWAWAPQLLRLYLGTLFSHLLLSIYITCEHRGLPQEGSILERTRTFDPGPVVRFLFWNMPYHAEHHAYPAVPFHALPALHTELLPQLRHNVGGILGLHLRGGRAARVSVSSLDMH
jgi:fatty acid desaturase